MKHQNNKPHKKEIHDHLISQKRYLAIKRTNKSKLQKLWIRNLVTTIQKQNFSFTSSIFADLENSWNNQFVSGPPEMKGKKPTLSTGTSL